MGPCEDGWNEAKKYMKINELYENTAHEAKKLLKTKYIALSKGENYAHLARQLA